MDKRKHVNYYYSIIKELDKFDVEDIEQGVFRYALNPVTSLSQDSDNIDEIVNILDSNRFRTDIESIIEFFELLLEDDRKIQNGIVFTPKYISDYIVETIFSGLSSWNSEFTIIDPGCGCGVFLVSAIEYINKKFQISVQTLLEKHILGADIDECNIRRCHLVMKILAAKNGEQIQEINCIKRMDSLKVNWKEAFGVKEITYVIGNPPYMNPHDLDNKTTKFLKSNFLTTTVGTFNIFYAFIEHSMNNLAKHGMLGFVVPNNFLTIKSATNLREYLQKNMFLEKIIDFGENMVFKPVRTYNSIIFLNQNQNQKFGYSVIDRTLSIKQSLKNIRFLNMPIASLDKRGWKLVNEQTRGNLYKIENQVLPIKEFIHTGIATLKDNAYLVEKDEVGFYKIINSEKFYIEPDLVKTIYKVPDLKQCISIVDVQRYIIFPYTHSDKGYKIIPEGIMMDKYPKVYAYLLSQRTELDARDRGKKNPQGWYAYGRTQGLNRYGKKLLFPTFANKSRFIYIDDEDALFCNGYAVFENERIDLSFLGKILSSFVMDYYVRNTSYAIQGGYYCYQKKYIERFSLPSFTDTEMNYIKESSQDDVDAFLIKKYDLQI